MSATADTLSVLEAAQRLGVSDGLLYRAVHGGHIVSIQLGRWWRIPTHEVERILREGLRVPSVERASRSVTAAISR